MPNLRLAIRQLFRSPGFILTVLVTLALAIGANTAIFSLVNALLITRLPYHQQECIATIFAHTSRGESYPGPKNIDGEQWQLLRDSVPSVIPAISSGSANGVNLEANHHIAYIRDGRISARYLDVLGLHPALGRNFAENEDLPHGPHAAILSYALWQSVFAGNPAVLGQPILLKGEPYTVIGILPRNTTTPLSADIYTAIQPSLDGEGAGTNYDPILRLRDGATWQQADAQINQAFSHSQWEQRFRKNNPEGTVTFLTVPLQRGQTSELRPQVLALMLAAGLILLIACANLAGLNLVRTARRSSEIATRLALGASRWQIQKQLWTENLLLALIGGLAGIGVGFLSLHAILLLLPRNFLPIAHIPLDGRVLAFTLTLSLLTSILCGMLPAFAISRVDLRSSISSRSIISSGSIRLRESLIAGEVALTVVLLAATGLLIHTLIHFETMPAGFDPHDVITAKASLDDARYRDPAAFRKLLTQSLDAMRQIPGVEAAAVGLSVPYERALIDSVALRDGKQAGQNIGTNEIYATPGYFTALSIPLLAGRAFTDADGPNTQHVALVNQSFAHKFYGAADPTGYYLGKDTRIIGVVADTVISAEGRLNNGTAPLTTEETIYIPAAQVDSNFLTLIHTWYQPSWIVRTRQSSSSITAAMQKALAAADPSLPFSGFYSMNDHMAETLATQRMQVALLTTMAALALLLSAIGIFALVANLVVQRRREIGIRLALGSTYLYAMIRIGRSGLGAVATGLILGAALCSLTLRALRSTLYGVGVYDPLTLLAVFVTIAAIAIAATSIPALRIIHIHPAETLREE